MSAEEAEDPVDSDFEDLEIPEEDTRDNASIKNRWQKLVKEGLVVPYRSVHDPPQSFKTPDRKCFIPGRPIFVKVVNVERTVSTHLLNPNLYVIQIQHGDFTWTVKRRYKHFQHLHQQLQLYRATLSIPFPTRTHQERRKTFKSNRALDESGKPIGLPRFPKRPEALVSSDQLEERKKVLETYLQNLVKVRTFRNHHETLEFLEVSHLSFVHGLGPKGKEGLVLKRTGTTHTRRCTFGLCNCVSIPCVRMAKCCGDCCGQWQRRWLIVKDTFVAYIRPKDGLIHCVMLYDPEFEVSSGLYDTGEPNGVVISNLSRQLVVKCWTKRRSKEWLEYMKTALQSEVAKSFIDLNRFSSFAPIRRDTTARWFIDGATYMSAVADALEAAHEEIFIADWWLSPEIYMKRPVVEGERWRLDKILERKAKEGVKIFILLYKEVNLALGINSFYSKQKLVQQNSENIKVLRHPDHVSAGVLLWAHHEKLVIVDQMYAFVAGIDLCYGRWDDQVHRLTDLGSVSKSQLNLALTHAKKITSSKPGGGPGTSVLQLARATNAVMGTVGHVPVAPDRQQLQELSKSASADGDAVLCEPPVEETVLTSKVTFSEVEALEAVPNGFGDGGEDFEEGFERDSMSDERVIMNGDVPLKGETPPTGRRNIFRRMTKVSRGLKEDGKEWIDRHLRRKSSGSASSIGDSDEDAAGKLGEESEDNLTETRARSVRAHSNTRSHATIAKSQSDSGLIGLQGSSKLWIGKDYTNFIVKDFTDLESPFTDLVDRNTTPRMPWHDIGAMVEGAAARDVARHFIQRWNAVKDEKARLNNAYPYLLPKTYDFRNDHIPMIFPADCRKSCKVTAQVVRSVSQWSAGIRMTEDSLMQAYVDSIENAKHYVYIENQFFISLAAANTLVQNRINEALLQRILRAHREKTNFRVFVIIPLLPGFEGEVGTNRGIAIHAITHWNYASISRGDDAIISRLQKEGIEDPSAYITFHGLRTHSELHGELITELIYVHSKLMIVDDNLVICGSANINDRSMLGRRDSEVGVVYQDEEHVKSVMDGKDYKAGKFAMSLRVNLFREHLGSMELDDFDLRDPVSEDFYRNVWLRTSLTNTEIYDQIFHCIPTDKCETFLQLQKYQIEPVLAVIDAASAKTLLQKARGNLVMLPLKFLQQENLLPAAGTREHLMPTQLWT